jgi:tetraacyldisaccharide-1-P 4'-kinase
VISGVVPDPGFQEPEICRKFAIKIDALRKFCTAKIIPNGNFL